MVDVNKLTTVDASARALAVPQAEQRLVAVRLSGVPAPMRRLMGIIGPDRDFPSRGRAVEAAVKRQRSAQTWPETSGACDA